MTDAQKLTQDAERAAEIAHWGTLAIQYGAAAAFCDRMHRLATIDNPSVREVCQRAYTADLHDKFMPEFIDEIGDFQEKPFAVVPGEGGNDAVTRNVRRRELEAEKRKLSEDESYRRMLEAKAVLGSQAEKAQAYAELAKLEDHERSGPEIEA